MACRNGSSAGNLESGGAALLITSVIDLQSKWIVSPSCGRSKSYDDCCEFHVSWLRANLDAIGECDDGGALLLPVRTGGDDCYAG